MRRTILSLVFILTMLAAGLSPVLADEQPPVLVYITWDGTPSRLVDRLFDEERMPNLQRLIDSGAYVRRSVGNWPSITPAGHAALWTGAYSSVNGISTNMPNVLTDEERSEDGADTRYGPVTAYGPSPFSAENLLVEPIWVTAARDGRTTTAVSVTHASPFEMYTTQDFVSSQGAHAFGDFSDDLLLSDPYRTASLPPESVTVEPSETNAADWTHVPAWPDAAFRSFTLGADTAENDEAIVLHGLAVAPDGETFTHVALSTGRNYETAQIVRDTPFANDASQLSGPVRYTDYGNADDCLTGYAHLRLTELADDGGSFTLWRTYLRDLTAYTTEPSRIDEWIAKGGAFTGNGAFLPPIDELPPLPNVYGEIAFQVNEYFFDNLVYELERGSADLYFSYSPYPDEWMHRLYGYNVESGPLFTPERAELASSYLNKMMANLDYRLGRSGA
ncbi:MAG: alkaline phosphatase family protein [Egibacteraceae bacterium]